MKIFYIEPDEWGWDLLTSELDDPLFHSIKNLSMSEEGFAGFDECIKGDGDYDYGFRWWFCIPYDINNPSKWKIGENHYHTVIKLLKDNGYTEYSW